MTQQKKIAAFDIDGTLTFTDSFVLFLRFTTTPIGFVIGMLKAAPFFLLYILKLIDRDKAKNALLRAFLKGMPETKYLDLCQSFARTIYPQILHLESKAIIQTEIQKCDEVALVSASLIDYIRPFADEIGVKHSIGTKMKIIEGFLTGEMDGKNCRAQEKCVRIYEYFGDCEIEAAYGDSPGDAQMLAAAKRPYYREIKQTPENYKAIIRKLYWGF